MGVISEAGCSPGWSCQRDNPREEVTLGERFTVHSQMSPDITAPSPLTFSSVVLSRHATVTAQGGEEEVMGG